MTGDPRSAARQRLDPAHYDYFAGGADDEAALRANREAFDRLALRPRVLRGAAPGPLRVDLPGAPGVAPVVVAPTAFHRLAHPDGEPVTARAAAGQSIVLTASMASTVAIGPVVDAAREVNPSAAVWFQLYVQPEPEVTDALVLRAADAGCTALVVTVDSPVFGRHTRDLRHGFTDLPSGLAAENLRDLPGTEPGRTRDIAMSPLISWDDITRLRDRTDLPILLKGVLHPDDAERAVRLGFDGVVVSNHGGRQLGAAIAAVEALPAVARAVAGRIPVLMDGGVRRGSDAAIALALGATAVGVGRPVVWGLAAAGQSGVDSVLAGLHDDLVHTMTLCGVADPAELTPDLVVRRGEWT